MLGAGDIARENLKTQQILAQYLQRRLFPQYYMQQQLKASLEAAAGGPPGGGSPEGGSPGGGAADGASGAAAHTLEDEALQTFESEQVSYFNNPEEGRFHHQPARSSQTPHSLTLTPQCMPAATYSSMNAFGYCSHCVGTFHATNMRTA